MSAFPDFPAFEVQYDMNGSLVDPAKEQALVDGVNSSSDIIVISHGWNNDIPEAEDLYTRFFTILQQMHSANTNLTNGQSFAAMWIFWPSKKFDEPQNIPGGSAAANDVAAAQQAVYAQLATLSDAFSNDPAAAALIDHARKMVPGLEDDPAARDAYVAALSTAFPANASEPDIGLDDARVRIDALKGDVLHMLSLPVIVRRSAPSDGGGGAALDSEAAAGILSNPFSSITGGALALANVFTYWTMKERAGLVGRTGVLKTVQRLITMNKRLHFVGHSFGARLVSATVNAMDGPPNAVASTLTLLQGAFSHYGFSPDYQSGKPGFFRSDIAAHKVSGEVQDTHSVHDWAVGIMYPIASRILNQSGAALGDASDFYGGLGRNGAQLTPEAFDDTLLDAGGTYPPLNGKAIRNLNGDAKITGHGDVCKPEIAYTLLRAIGASAGGFH